MSCPSKAPAIICAENIALTRLLHEVPQPPSRNQIPQSLVDKKGYALPLLKEQGLVETLAFLSKLTDGPDHIPAICILQDPKGSSLKVILAMNKVTQENGEKVLRNLQSEFETIFRILKLAQYDRSSNAERTIFDGIMRMCSPRILCRLRLTGRARGESRTTITDALKEASRGIARINPQNLGPRMILSRSLFSQRERQVTRLVKAWSNYQTIDSLGEVVQEIHRMNHIQNISHMLSLVPNREMDPTLKKSLLNMIEKVSRYREAARTLYRMAKKYMMVRHMSIEPVNLPTEAFTRISKPQYLPNLEETASRLQISGHNMAALYQILGHNPKSQSPKLEDRFRDLVLSSLENAKIHAEVQIIAWCVIWNPQLHPRILSSSKDACYLCNRLIDLYGEFHTPKTHGRLYPGWRLPSLFQFKHLEQDFNIALANQIQQSSQTILKNQKPILHHQPNESTLLSLLNSVTTTSTVQLRGNNDTTEEVQAAALPPQAASTSISSKSISLKDAMSSLPTSSSFSSASTDTTIPLEHGHIEFDHARRGKIPPFFVAGPLQISIEIEEESLLRPGTIPLAWNIEWIKLEDMERAHEDNLIVDAQLLNTDQMYSLPDSRSFCIVSGNVMLKINCYTPMINH